MAKRREKTIKDLLLQTEKLSDCRPSCVLDGKAKMRGPGVNDPPDDAESMKVCYSCGCPVPDDDLHMCSICDEGFHTSCLELPINASLSVALVCSQCQGVSSQLRQASEASLNSSSVICGQTATALDAQSGRPDVLWKGATLSFSQNTSCEGSKSMASVDDSVKPIDISKREWSNVTEGPSSSVPEDGRKSDLVSGESSDQSPVLEYVRRSKRGRPYKPVGGLHPNKRRSIDKASRHTDRVLQGRSKPVIDEEDELGAKIEKFRVISSIDGKSLTKGAASLEDSKDPSFGMTSLRDEKGDVQANIGLKKSNEVTGRPSTGLAVEPVGFADSSVVSDGKTSQKDSKLASGVKVECLSAVREAAGKGKSSMEDATLKLEYHDPVDSPSLLASQSDVGLGIGQDLSLPAVQSDCQQIHSGHAQEKLLGVLQAKIGGGLPNSTLQKTMNGSNLAECARVSNLEMDMKKNVQPMSTTSVMETDAEMGNARVCDGVSEDEPQQRQSSSGKEGKKVSRTRVSHAELRVRDTDVESVRKGVGAEEVMQDSDCKQFVGDDFQRVEPAFDMTSKSDDQGMKESATFQSVGCHLESALSGEGQAGGVEGIRLSSLDDDSAKPGDIANAQTPDSHHSVMHKCLVETAEKSLAKGTFSPVAVDSVLDLMRDTHEDSIINPSVVAESSSIPPPCSSRATNPDSEFPPQSSPTSVLQGKIQPEDIPHVLEVEQGPPSAVQASLGVRDTDDFSPGSVDAFASSDQATSATMSFKQEPDTITVGASQSVVKETVKGSWLPANSSTSNDGRRHSVSVGPLEVVVAKDVPSSGCMQLVLDTGVATSGELANAQLSICEQGAVSANVVNVLPSHSGTSAEPDMKLTDKTGDGERSSPGSCTSVPVSVQPGRSPDHSAQTLGKEQLPGVSKKCNVELEELALTCSQSAPLDEEDDVKVCDICGDAGYEECLAVCSACNEGAEHIYCMQALLRVVPDDGWLCEGCKLKESTGNLKQVEDCPFEHALSGPAHFISKKKQIVKDSTRSRLSACLEKGKGSPQRKGATKGLPNHQLSTKRAAEDLGAASSVKKQALESTGLPFNGSSMFPARGLSRENSLKTPDSGKVKFLSPNELAGMPVGGFRNFGKSLGLAGPFSHSPRPGLNQVSQVASKNRYVSSDSTMGVASTATKQPPLTPRPPSAYAAPPSTPVTGKGPGSMRSSEPVPTIFAPSRSGIIPSPSVSKEGASEVEESHHLVKDTSTTCKSVAGGSGKGPSAVISGQTPTRGFDTPKHVLQLPGLGIRSTALKNDASNSFQVLEGTVLRNKVVASQKRGETLDTRKSFNNSTRFPSFSKLSNAQSSKDEAQVSQELQVTKGMGDAKFMDCSGAATSTGMQNIQRGSSIVSPADSQGLNPVQGASQKLKGFGGFSKTEPLYPPGTVIGNSQRIIIGGAPDSEDLKQPSKASVRASSIDQLVLDETVSKTSKEAPLNKLDLKPTDSLEKCWSSKIMAPMQGTRCYKCKEIGHSAQMCTSRTAASTVLANLASSSNEVPASTRSPKGSLVCSSSTLWKNTGPRASGSSYLGEQKDAVISAVELVRASPRQEIEPVGSAPVVEISADSRKGWNKGAVSGSLEEVSMRAVDDTRRQALNPSWPNQGVNLPRASNEGGESPVLTSCGDLPSVMIGMEKVVSNPGTPVLVDPVRMFSSPLSASVRHLDGVPGDDFTAEASVREAKQPDSKMTASQENPLRNSNEGVQGGLQGINVLTGPCSTQPPYFLGPSQELPFLTPMMVLQPKGLGPWGQPAPPRPMSGMDRMLNQDARAVRVGGGTGNGVGASVSHAPGNICPSAVPVSQCLWRGGFEVVSAAVPAFYDGLQGYSSSFAAAKVHEVTKTLPARLQLEEVRRMYSADAWPKQFQQRPPTYKEIALYFFPDSDSAASFEECYRRLLEHMITNDLVLMGQVEGAEILIFPSHLLPVEYHRWKSKMFLWGVFRARKLYPLITSSLDSGQASIATCSKVVLSDQAERLASKIMVAGPEKVAPGIVHADQADNFVSKTTVSSQVEKLVKPETLIDCSASAGGHAGEVDMEIDMIGDKEIGIQLRPTRKSGWDQPTALISPPLPHEPPPVQPPPPVPVAICGQEGNTAHISHMEISMKECNSAHLDAPPGFGPVPHKQEPQHARPPGFGSTPIGPPGFEIAPNGPPGFEKVRDGISAAEVQAMALSGDIVGSTADVEVLESTSNQLQGVLRRENNAVEFVRLSSNSRQGSPLLAPSPSPRDLRDDSAVGTSHASFHRYSHSSSRSPVRHRGRTKDRSGSRASFYGRDRGRDRERDRARDRDREVRREKDKERRRERGRDRERERERDKVKERSFIKDRDKHRAHEHKDRRKASEHKYRRRERSCSQSPSWSRSYSAPRRRPQSPSISPTKRHSSGRRRSRYRSRSYSDSPDSNTRKLWRTLPSTERQVGSRDRSQHEVCTLRRATSRSDDVNRDGKIVQGTQNLEADCKSRLLVFSDQQDTADKKGRADEQKLSENSIPFYDIHQDQGEARSQSGMNEKCSQASVPTYHVFLPAESGDAHMLETDTPDDEAVRPFFPKIWPSPGANASDLEVLLKQPQPEAYESTSQWESEKAVECTGYEFFPVNTGNTGKRTGSSTNPYLDLGLGEHDKSNTHRLEPLPFFVHNVDTTVSSADPVHKFPDSVGPAGRTMRFPPVTHTKQKPGITDGNSLALTLSVPQYRKEGSMWVKIEDSEALLGEEDVDFALTL